MAFRLPVFNLDIAIWRHDTPLTEEPDVFANANFNHGRRVLVGDTWTARNQHAWYPTSFLLLPMGTDIRGDSDDPDKGDTVEIPIGSGAFYHVLHQDRTALGFPNEHMTAIVVKKSVLNYGSAGGGGGIPGGGDNVLVEDGGLMLLEDGGGILLEDTP